MHRIKHMQHSTPGAEKLRVAQHQSRHLLPSRCPIANCQELPLLPGSWGDVGPAAGCFTQRISTRSETSSHKSPNHTGRWANADSSVVNLSLLYLVPLSFYLLLGALRLHRLRRFPGGFKLKWLRNCWLLAAAANMLSDWQGRRAWQKGRVVSGKTWHLGEKTWQTEGWLNGDLAHYNGDIMSGCF
jgi:hypothetical protein